MAESIAVLDLGAFRAAKPQSERFAASLASACQNSGGFCIRNHGIDDALLASVRHQSEAFFGLDEEFKSRTAVKAGHHGGYISPTCSTPLAAGADDFSGMSRLCEGYRVHLELDRDDPMVTAGVPLYGANVWPSVMPQFRRSLTDCFDILCDLSLDILRALATVLRIDRETLVPYFENPLSTLSLLFSPPEKATADDRSRVVRPSRDSSAFTILLGDVGSGVELQGRDGSWASMPAIEGALTVVIGNMMEAWSGGRLQSAQHRFTGHSGGASYPFVFSAVPNYGTVIRPLPGHGSNYRPVHVGPYMEAFYQGRI